MKRYFSLSLIALTIVLLSGCAGFPEYMNRSGKSNLNSVNGTEYQSSDFEVLGHVEADANGVLLLGLVTNGEDGAGLLWEEAVSEYGDQVTGIKDIRVKNKYQGILSPIYSKINTTYYGVAVSE